MDQSRPIYNQDISLWFLVRWNKCLKDRGELRLLASVQLSTLTQCSWECQILMLEELLQITLSSLSGDEQLWGELAALLQTLLLWVLNRSSFLPEEVSSAPLGWLIEGDRIIYFGLSSSEFGEVLEDVTSVPWLCADITLLHFHNFITASVLY